MGVITRHQQRAIDFVEQQAKLGSERANDCIDAILARANVTRESYDKATAILSSQAQIAVHFHPERISRFGKVVAEGLLQSGRFKNQFETGLSSGSTSAFPGGARDLWERHLFGGAYHADDVHPSVRPKYGALHLLDHPDGPAPRFGSCYFLLHPTVSARSTFTFGGSQEPDALLHTGSINTLAPIFARIFNELELGQGAFGISELNVASLLDDLICRFSTPANILQNAKKYSIEKLILGRALDSFVEVQIHGEIRLDKDVSQLVADPAFQDQHTGEVLGKISTRYGIPLSWHPGFMLKVEQVPYEFRGYPIAPLARRAAKNGLLDAADIGALANSLELEPDAWKDWASYDDTLIQFRRLWHFMVMEGAPRGMF
ncbi:MAG: DUF3626 domain-containing protein [Gammaproteobacteria bacterium]|nr:MAG: DUF3626 domain-containing protein [Gammaproteobacteria bacterium]